MSLVNRIRVLSQTIKHGFHKILKLVGILVIDSLCCVVGSCVVENLDQITLELLYSVIEAVVKVLLDLL
jgi:hypothetical protein